ncbi:hypothetical protein C8Q73DRAFT_154480 [Cubamyces lactineus]|nr:hypothetical protein C8Q73DRAFT_154480 [Cubamyces lactineus]
MEDEGRPLPDAEAVARLEQILNPRDPVTGDLVCPLALPDQIPLLRFSLHTPADREEKLNVLYPAQRPGQSPSLFVHSTSSTGGTVVYN